jgi:D-glycero-D-manno-heptose 1,7-bisphosphate phosphatase
MRNEPRAVFLDRDGTLNVEKEYLSDPEQLVLFPDVIDALTRLRDAGYLLVIVTNQSGIGRGYYTESEMHEVNERLLQILRASAIEIAEIYYAPEAPEEPSRGRKPSPQFLIDARKEFKIDLSRSFMIGDKISDLECGWNAGVKKSILVRTGYGQNTEAAHSAKITGAVIVNSLNEAVDYILSEP